MRMAGEHDRMATRKRLVEARTRRLAPRASGEAPARVINACGCGGCRERAVRDEEHVPRRRIGVDHVADRIHVDRLEIAEHPEIVAEAKGIHRVGRRCRRDARQVRDFRGHERLGEIEVGVPRTRPPEVMVAKHRQERKVRRKSAANGRYGVVEHLRMHVRVVAVPLHEVAHLEEKARGFGCRQRRTRRDEARTPLAPHVAVAQKLLEMRLGVRFSTAPICMIGRLRRIARHVGCRHVFRQVAVRRDKLRLERLVEVRVAENGHRVHRAGTLRAGNAWQREHRAAGHSTLQESSSRQPHGIPSFLSVSTAIDAMPENGSAVGVAGNLEALSALCQRA